MAMSWYNRSIEKWPRRDDGSGGEDGDEDDDDDDDDEDDWLVSIFDLLFWNMLL